MPSTKDLLEAHSYARRRLVAAFLTGDPAPDLARPGPVRLLVLSLVAAALLVGGVAAYSHLLG